MGSDWFANRGQAIQAALTFIGVLISGANAWPAISSFQFLSIAPIVFYVLIGLLILIVMRRAQHSITSASENPKDSVGDPQATASAKFAKTTTEVADVVNRDVQQFKLSMGEVWKLGDRRVVLHDIAKNTEKPRSALFPDSDYVADVEVSFGGRLIYIGPSVRDNKNRHFLVPVSPSGHNAEPGSLYAFSYSSTHVNFEFFTISHINFHKKEIDAVFGVLTAIAGR